MDNLQERIEQAANAIYKAVTQLTGYGANNTTYLAETKQLIRDMAARIESERQIFDSSQQTNEALLKKLRSLEAENQKLREAKDLLEWIYKKYSDMNLSFADNWFAETQDFLCPLGNLPQQPEKE